MWNPERQEIVVEALPAISTPPLREEVVFDPRELVAEALHSAAGIEPIEETAIFGGYLLRHFGHFCHESLGRLWWLSQGDGAPGAVQAVSRRLQEEKANVYFFTPPWLDSGKDLLSSMA
jgi:hypothetical protein